MSNRTYRESATFPTGPVDHIRGPMKAAIELVEYSDFECPLCAQAYYAIGILLQQFKHRIRFVFRHFPLVEIHPHAELAAELRKRRVRRASSGQCIGICLRTSST